MSLQIRYNRVSTAGGVDPDHITARMGVSFSSAAEEGSVAQTGMTVDDTANALDYVGLRRVYAFETAAPAHNQIVWNGYLQERRIGRDPAEGQDSDVEIMGRRWDLAIADTNSLLSRRLITGSDGDRGAETDIARIQWLLDSNDKYLSNPQDVWANPSAYIDTTGPIAMDASDLRGQTAFDVLNDCAQRSGKNWFAVYDEATDTVPPTNAGKYTLHYYKPEATYYTSTLRLTNVNADADNVTTFYVYPDAILTRDPGRSYSGIYLTGDGVSLYQQSTNVINLFQQRDAAVSNPNVKTMAKATALAARYLADATTEDDRLTCRFVVAKQYVNSLREGQRFQAKFSHLPGYPPAYGYWRCLRRTVTQRTDEFYEIAIEATPQAVEASFVQIGYEYNLTTDPTTNVSLPVASSAGNLLVAAFSQVGATGQTVAGWTTIVDAELAGPTSYNYLFWKISTGDQTITIGSGSSVGAIAEYILPGGAPIGGHVSNRQNPGVGLGTGPTVTYGAGRRIILGVCFADDGPTGADNASVTAPGTLRHAIAGADHGAADIYFSDSINATTASAGSTSWNYVNTGTLPTLSVGVEFG